MTHRFIACSDPHMLSNYSLLATFLSLTIKGPMFTVHSFTHAQLRQQQPTNTSAVPPGNRTLIWTGHSGSCQQQTSRTGCSRKVQRC